MIVWLASYPKSGNTFLRSLLSSYFLTNDGYFQLKSLKQIKQFPALGLFKKFGIDISNDLELVKNYLNVQQKMILQDKKTIRFLKTHSSLQNINGYKFTDLNNSLGVIYVVRDPRSVAKSYANHYQMSLESATDKLLKFSTLTASTKHSNNTNDRHITHVGSWASNYNTWKEFKKIDRYLLIKYENLVLDTEKTFVEVLNFIFQLGKLNIKIDVNKLKNTIESTSFSKMQKLEKNLGFPEALKDNDGKRITFFKYGLKNNNPNYFPENLNSKIKQDLKNELEELDYI